MIPVYQTIIAQATDKLPGNCMQAVMASLLEVSLEEVPHFLLFDDWWGEMNRFMTSKGYPWFSCWQNANRLGANGEQKLSKLVDQPGIGGYFFAAVYSPKYFTPQDMCTQGKVAATHAVVIDKNCNIVHDPNPNYKGMDKYPLHHILEFNGVLFVDIYQPK